MTDGEFTIEGMDGKPAGVLTLAITDDTPTLQDEVARALIATGALSPSEALALGGDAIELAQSFGSIILGLEGVANLVEQLPEVRRSKLWIGKSAQLLQLNGRYIPLRRQHGQSYQRCIKSVFFVRCRYVVFYVSL